MGYQRLDAFFELCEAGQRFTVSKDAPDQLYVSASRRLIQADDEVFSPCFSQVCRHRDCARCYRICSVFGVNTNRIKHALLAVVGVAKAQALKTLGQNGCVSCDALRDTLQTHRPVIHRIHARHHRRQHLRGADVTGGFFSANVLLAGL